MISKKNRRKGLVLLIFFLFLTITVLSLLPAKSTLNLGNKDKLSHFIAYFILSFTVFQHWKISRNSIWVLFALIGYGLFLEFLQGFVPGRVSSLFDGLANTIGVFLGTITTFIQNKIYEKR
jgi:VanZ family protein